MRPTSSVLHRASRKRPLPVVPADPQAMSYELEGSETFFDFDLDLDKVLKFDYLHANTNEVADAIHDFNDFTDFKDTVGTAETINAGLDYTPIINNFDGPSNASLDFGTLAEGIASPRYDLSTFASDLPGIESSTFTSGLDFPPDSLQGNHVLEGLETVALVNDTPPVFEHDSQFGQTGPWAEH